MSVRAFITAFAEIVLFRCRMDDQDQSVTRTPVAFMPQSKHLSVRSKTTNRLFVVDRRSSFIVRRSSFAVRCAPFVVRRSSFVVRRSSFIVQRSSFIVHRYPSTCRRRCCSNLQTSNCKEEFKPSFVFRRLRSFRHSLYSLTLTPHTPTPCVPYTPQYSRV